LREAPPKRLHDDEYARLCDVLRQAGISLCSDIEVRDRLAAVRRLYEPHACSLAAYLRLDLPLWAAPPPNPSKPDMGASVSKLRSPSASGLQFPSISPPATASPLG